MVVKCIAPIFGHLRFHHRVTEDTEREAGSTEEQPGARSQEPGKDGNVQLRAQLKSTRVIVHDTDSRPLRFTPLNPLADHPTSRRHRSSRAGECGEFDAGAWESSPSNHKTGAFWNGPAPTMNHEIGNPPSWAITSPGSLASGGTSNLRFAVAESPGPNWMLNGTLDSSFNGLNRRPDESTQ